MSERSLKKIIAVKEAKRTTATKEANKEPKEFKEVNQSSTARDTEYNPIKDEKYDLAEPTYNPEEELKNEKSYNPEDDEDSDGKMLDNYSPNIVFIAGNICNDACVIANPKTERVEELNLCLSNQSPSIT